jgi:hypothetical protein
LVTGIFHTDKSIRTGCSIRLRHHFEIPYPSAGNRDKDTLCDPFDRSFGGSEGKEGLFFMQTSLAAGVDISTPRSLPTLDATASVFELKDIRRLTDIFITGDHDLTIQLSALHQLVSITNSDRNLLRGIEVGWCINLINSVLDKIEKYVPTILSSSLSTEERDLVNLLLALVVQLVMTVRGVRAAFEFSSASSEKGSRYTLISFSLLSPFFLISFSYLSRTHTSLTFLSPFSRLLASLLSYFMHKKSFQKITKLV